MKILIIIFLIAISSSVVFSQDKNLISSEIDANFYNYCISKENTNKFNYGFSLLFSRYLRKLKISFGINYSTKYYNAPGNAFFEVERREYNLQYLNFPIIMNYPVITKEKHFISFLTGITFNNIIDYRIRSYYYSGDIYIADNLLNQKSLGMSLNIGLTISVTTGKNTLFNLSPIISIKIVPDHDVQKYSYKNIPDDIFSIGLKIGIEYLIK